MIRPRLPLALCACAALAALAACQDRREEPKASNPSITPSASPSATASAGPSVSIIRPDITPQPVVDLPPPPLSLTIGFPDGGARLDPAAEQALAGLLKSEQLAEGWPVALRGHSDSAGSDAANLATSHRRAEAVAAWLGKHGVAEDRIEIVAFGEQNPVAPNALPDGTPNDEGRAKNRRVEIRIAPPKALARPENAADQTDEGDGA
jgi:OOP family OmpA-OmpF porin